MVTEQDRYIGPAILLLLDSVAGTTVSRLASPGGAGFVVNNDCLVYLKYATSRLTPWSFSFHPSHAEYLNSAEVQKYSRRVIGLICGVDGVAGILDNELFTLLSPYIDKTTSITVSRPPRQHYHLTAGRVPLPYSISKDEFENKIKGQLPDLSSQHKIAWPSPPKKAIYENHSSISRKNGTRDSNEVP
jgi:hypothetical protein